MMKKIFICALLLVSGISLAENPNLDYSTDTIEGIVLYRYPVEKSIGLYRVSVNFAVPQSMIIEWNPFLKERGLQFGDTLYIPTGRPIVNGTTETIIAEETKKTTKETAEETIEETIEETTEEVTEKATEEVNEEVTEKALNKRKNRSKKEANDLVVPMDSIIVSDSLTAPLDSTASFKLALLLPLQAESGQRNETMDRFLDFYEGCLIALKDRQDSTQRVDLFVYDTKKDTTDIVRLMQNELLSMNAIIGPAYPQQVALIDTFVKNHQIPTMIPFTNEVDSLENNPYLYLFNTTAQMDADTFLNYLEQRGELTNCVLVEAKDEDIHKDILYLRNQIKERALPYTETTLHEILVDSVFMNLMPEIENIVIFNSTKFTNVQILLPHLINGKADCRVSLFSQFGWQKERIVMPQIYTTIFATDSVPALAQYETTYSTYFGHQHASLIPRYDLLGYDITRQFLDRLFGNDPTPGLQSDIRFTQAGDGGFVNTHIMLMHK